MIGRRRPRQTMSNWQLAAVLAACLLVVVGAMLWYGISTGDQLDMVCTGGRGFTPRNGECYPPTTDP